VPRIVCRHLYPILERETARGNEIGDPEPSRITLCLPVREPRKVHAAIVRVRLRDGSRQYRCREHGDTISWRPNRYDPPRPSFACRHLRPLYRSELWRGNLCCGAVTSGRWVTFCFIAGFAEHRLGDDCLSRSTGDTHYPDEAYSCAKHRQILSAIYNHSVSADRKEISRACADLRPIVEAEWERGNDVVRAVSRDGRVRVVLARLFRARRRPAGHVKFAGPPGRRLYHCWEHRHILQEGTRE
jgi:hypothetical protein